MRVFLSPGDTDSDEEDAESQDSGDLANYDSVMETGRASHRRYGRQVTVSRRRGAARVRGRHSAIRSRRRARGRVVQEEEEY